MKRNIFVYIVSSLCDKDYQTIVPRLEIELHNKEVPYQVNQANSIEKISQVIQKGVDKYHNQCELFIHWISHSGIKRLRLGDGSYLSWVKFENELNKVNFSNAPRKIFLSSCEGFHAIDTAFSSTENRPFELLIAPTQPLFYREAVFDVARFYSEYMHGKSVQDALWGWVCQIKGEDQIIASTIKSSGRPGAKLARKLFLGILPDLYSCPKP